MFSMMASGFVVFQTKTTVYLSVAVIDFRFLKIEAEEANVLGLVKPPPSPYIRL